MLKLRAQVEEITDGEWHWTIQSVNAAGTGTNIAQASTGVASAALAEADLRTFLSSLDAMGAGAWSFGNNLTQVPFEE